MYSSKKGENLEAIDCADSKKWLSLKNIDIGSATRREMIAFDDDLKKSVSETLRKCMIVTAQYLQSRLPLSNPILKDLRCLHPGYRSHGKKT